MAAKCARIPIIGTFHRSELSAFQKSLGKRLGNAFLNHKIAISKNRKALMVKGLNILPDQITVIHGGTDLKIFCPVSSQQKKDLRKKLGISADIPVLLSLGHLGPIKGHETTLESIPEILKSHPDTHLFIGGDGSSSEKTSLMRIIQSKNIGSHVTLLGQIGQPQEWLGACDIFVQPSVEEGFGQVFAEAGAVGRPAIGTQIGGIP